MGRSISHGNGARGTIYRSGSAMHEVGQQVAHLVTASDWRVVKDLFHLAQRADGPFSIPASKAGPMAAVLRKAADHPLMPATFQGDGLVSAPAVRELADAAGRAAAAREPWEWR